MTDLPKPSPLHPAHALEALASSHQVDLDLFAREINVYIEAVRTRAGRTKLTSPEVQTLFWRMWDVARLGPERAQLGGLVSKPASPVDLDALRDEMAEDHPKPNGKRTLP